MTLLEQVPLGMGFKVSEAKSKFRISLPTPLDLDVEKLEVTSPVLSLPGCHHASFPSC